MGSGDETGEVALHDGRRAVIRVASVRDADGVAALGRVLAEAGDGMVMTADQARSVDDERRRIDDVYRAAAAGDATVCLVALLGERVVGLADLKQLAPSRARHVGVLSVGVHPDVQRQGVGRALMERLVAHARACRLLRLELYVRADNAKAVALYESLGFAIEGTRRKFVRRDDGTFVDDHLMALLLEP